jgi:hypothetical protein
MMVIACPSCLKAIRVSGDMSEIETLVGRDSTYYPDKYTCYSCGNPAISARQDELPPDLLSSLEVVELSPQEALAAIEGMGIPEEQTCCEEVLKELFGACGIKLHGRQPRGKARYYIDHMELPDGTRVYFGSSPIGVAIYRIARRHSYVEALDEAGS